MGTVCLLLSGVQQEVHVIDIGTRLILPWHVCGAPVRITLSKVPKALSLDLLHMQSTQAGMHLLHTLDQTIRPSVLHKLKLDPWRTPISLHATATGPDQPPQLSIRVLIEHGSLEFWIQMIQEQGQGGEVALETKAATMAQLVLLSEYQGHLQNFRLD
jgi:hypothetical protein